MVQRTWIIIPARVGSTRFPSKPLAQLAGRRVLDRTLAIARAAQTLHPNIEQIILATDSDEIERAAADTPGVIVWKSSQSFRNGTERCSAYIRAIESQPGSSALPQWVINLQGDALLTPPWAITSILEAAQVGSFPYATGGLQLSWDAFERLKTIKATGRGSGTFVVTDSRGKGLYFSKNPIPAVRIMPDRAGSQNLALPNLPSPFWRHIGVYVYQTGLLNKIASLAPTPLEITEDLEQLRALEHGYALQVVPLDYRGRSHDSLDYPEDLQRIEAIIEAEGELIP